MMKFDCNNHLVLVFVFFALLTVSCNKVSTPFTAAAVQVITVSPLEGFGGTTVTIKGSGFSASPGLDSVYFNGKAAVVTFAQDTILRVTVPSMAGTGNVSVKVNGVTVTGPVFTYDYQGVVTTYAGTPGGNDVQNGPKASATFNDPRDLAADDSGNLYVADYGNNLIRKISFNGTVSSLIRVTGNPTGVVVDNKGSLFVSLFNFPVVLQVSLATGNSTLLSGKSSPGFVNSTISSNVEFTHPAGLAVGQHGNIYVADYGNQLIRMVTPAGAASTFAGDYPSAGAVNGAGDTATFNGPLNLVFDGAGNSYVADAGNNMIRKITPGGTVSTLAGGGHAGYTNGTGAAASFADPTGIAIDSKGNLYVADYQNNLVRMITPAGKVSTIAGSGIAGYNNGTGAAASFNGPWGITCDANDNLYVSDNGDNTIRKITLQ